MSFNEQLPKWDAPGVEPPESKKITGYLPSEKPPADWFNWLFNRIYKVLQEIRNTVYQKSDVDTALNEKAPLNSPNFTGQPTATTAVAGTNSTQIATTEFVKSAIDAIPDVTASDILSKIKTVDGTGSGLDADTVKGYVPLNKAGDTMIGNPGTKIVDVNPQNATANSWSHPVHFQYRDAANVLKSAFLQADPSGNIKHNGTGTFWHSGNDGASSGLDADLLDGLDSTAFARKTQQLANGTNLNNILDTGFFDGSNLVNAPNNKNTWFYLIVIRHTSDASNNRWIQQIAYDFDPGEQYTRQARGGTGNWTPWSTMFKSAYMPPGSDFNNYKSEGEYYCPLNSDAATMLNRPTSLAFSLKVTRHADVNQTVTEFVSDQTFQIYTRNLYNGVWSAWKKVMTSSNVVVSAASPSGGYDGDVWLQY